MELGDIVLTESKETVKILDVLLLKVLVEGDREI